MKSSKKALLSISHSLSHGLPLTPQEIDTLLSFQKTDKPVSFTRILKNLAVPLSIYFGFLLAVFSDSFSQLTTRLPSWTNLTPQTLAGVDYLWDLLGEPVRKPNLVYHLPNIILYSFGIVGIKKLIDSLERKSWLDQVISSQTQLKQAISTGQLFLKMKPGHSLLFVGKGDFIGMQFTLNHHPHDSVTISEVQPAYTHIWNRYDVSTLYDDLKNVISRSDGASAGEYIFFPVKDDQIFLPGEKSYDLSPHKLDILCQNLRTIEKEHQWSPKRIIIIGDKFHKSFVQSEDEKHVLSKTQDSISLSSIAQKYSGITLLDPTDIVLKKILEIAAGRKIVFRATKEGIAEYKTRFYNRLSSLGYKSSGHKKGILTIGYDLFEDQTEQQTLSRVIDDYFPVVLSKNVRDALIRNGYKESEFLYVPQLVLATLHEVTSQQ